MRNSSPSRDADLFNGLFEYVIADATQLIEFLNGQKAGDDNESVRSPIFRNVF
jgi:hypothetical protein